MTVPSTRERIRAWERLRVPYNLVMLVVGAPLAFFVYAQVDSISEHLRRGLLLSYTRASVTGVCLIVGVAANAMYTLGPLAELYLANLMTFRRRERMALFLLGILVSLGVMGFVFLVYLTLPRRLGGFDS